MQKNSHENYIESKYYSTKQSGNLFDKVTKRHGFSMSHFNIPGLSKNLSMLRDLLYSVQDIPDIIAITETKLTENSVSNICIPGYVFLNANSKTFAGGVGLELLADGVESCWIEIPRKRQKNVVIGSIYRHPFNDRAQFLDILKDKMINLSNKGREIFVLGDKYRFFKIQ